MFKKYLIVTVTMFKKYLIVTGNTNFLFINFLIFFRFFIFFWKRFSMEVSMFRCGLLSGNVLRVCVSCVEGGGWWTKSNFVKLSGRRLRL